MEKEIISESSTPATESSAPETAPPAAASVSPTTLPSGEPQITAAPSATPPAPAAESIVVGTPAAPAAGLPATAPQASAPSDTPQLSSTPATPAPPPSLIERYGGEQAAEPALRLGHTALSAENPGEFWIAAHQESPGRTTELVDAMIQNWPEAVIERLQAQGKLPANISAPTSAPNEIHPAELEAIPHQYHEAYSSLSDAQRYALQSMEEGERDLLLSQISKGLERDKAEQAAATERAQAAEQARAESVRAEGQAFHEGIRGALKQQLASAVQLTGDADTDAFLTEVILDHVENSLDRDPQAFRFIQQAMSHLQSGERAKLRGVGFQIQAQAALKMNQMLPRLAGVFDKARKYDEAMRQQAKGRVEVSGSGQTNAPPSRGSYLKNGQFDPAKLEEIKQGVRDRMAQST